MAIELNTGKPQASALSQAALESLSKLSGENSAELEKVVGKAMEVLAGANLRVSKSDIAGADGTAERKTTGATNVPVLDNPGDPGQVEANLEKLISYLQLDNQERQTEMARDRIDLQKSELDVEHDDRMKQINDSIAKMKKAENASKWSRIFGWIGAVLAVVAAAVLTVVTGGVAAGFAIAGAALAVTALTMSETGATEKLVEKLANHMQEKYGWSKSDAQLFASLVINLSIMVLQLGCSIGGMVGGMAAAASAAANAAGTAANAASTAANTANVAANTANVASHTAKTVQNVVTIANTVVGAGSLATNGVSTYMTHNSENAKADTTELEKFMAMLRQRLDESQEELQQILQQMQAAIGNIAQMIASATDTSATIAQNLGAMA